MTTNALFQPEAPPAAAIADGQRLYPSHSLDPARMIEKQPELPDAGQAQAVASDDRPVIGTQASPDGDLAAGWPATFELRPGEWVQVRPLIDFVQFAGDKLPREPFELRAGEWVSDPDLFYRRLIENLQRDSSGPNARGALRDCESLKLAAQKKMGRPVRRPR